MMQNRTHTCGELRLSDAGKQVKISGWMENVRVVSANLAFVVVRDFYGTTQVVAETEDMVNIYSLVACCGGRRPPLLFCFIDFRTDNRLRSVSSGYP